MAEHNSDVEDAASVMEKLWGPREQAPPDVVVVPMTDLWGPGRGVELPARRRVATAPDPTAAPESAVADSAAPDMEKLRKEIEAGLTDQLASLRAELISAVASVEERLSGRADALVAERAAMVESTVLARLDDLREQIRAELAAAAGRASESDARLLLRLEDTSTRVAAIDDRLDAEVGRVAAALGRVEASSATSADLEAVRAAMQDELGEVQARFSPPRSRWRLDLRRSAPG